LVGILDADEVDDAGHPPYEHYGQGIGFFETFYGLNLNEFDHLYSIMEMELTERRCGRQRVRTGSGPVEDAWRLLNNLAYERLHCTDD
jgi:hypothetical protein